MKLKSILTINPKLSYRLFFLFLTLIYWNLAIRVVLLLRLLGSPTNNFNEVFSKGLNFFVDKIGASSLIISVFAIMSWAIHHYIYPRLVQKFQIRRLTVIVVLFDIAIFFLMSILLGIAYYGISIEMKFIYIFKLSNFLFNSTTLFFLIVIIVASYIYQLVFTLVHQVGRIPLFRMIIGYYQKPREENMIFMFLDLQSSTKFAEILGHKKYSYFIQDCFRFLTTPVLTTLGRVYQFVGDEVVVTWNANKFKNYKRAVDFFYCYEKELSTRKAYFEKKYGVLPVFTASINCGKVMAAEVGEIKKELAFHGDVLNTAARIQKQCKTYGEKILVTGNFVSKLANYSSCYQTGYIDTVKLAGKNREVEIFAVSDIYKS